MEMEISDPPPSYEEVMNVSKLDLDDCFPKPPPYTLSRMWIPGQWDVTQPVLVEDRATFWKFMILTALVLIIMIVVYKVVYCEY